MNFESIHLVYSKRLPTYLWLTNPLLVLIINFEAVLLNYSASVSSIVIHISRLRLYQKWEVTE